jgi:hypothetical protein
MFVLILRLREFNYLCSVDFCVTVNFWGFQQLTIVDQNRKNSVMGKPLYQYTETLIFEGYFGIFSTFCSRFTPLCRPNWCRAYLEPSADDPRSWLLITPLYYRHTLRHLSTKNEMHDFLILLPCGVSFRLAFPRKWCLILLSGCCCGCCC